MLNTISKRLSIQTATMTSCKSQARDLHVPKKFKNCVVLQLTKKKDSMLDCYLTSFRGYSNYIETYHLPV